MSLVYLGWIWFLCIARIETKTILTCCVCSCHKTMIVCDYSSLTSFAYIALRNATLISMKGNALSELNDMNFSVTQSVDSIDLSSNNIERISPNTFSGLTELTHLNLSFNRIHYSYLPQQVFTHLSNLLVLSLNSQQIQPTQQGSLPTGIFRTPNKLKELHMTGTPFMNEAFSSLVSLEILNLGDAGCLIPSVSRSHFPSLFKLENLTILSLRYCEIKYLENQVTVAFQRLAKLDVSCNPDLFRSLQDALNGTYNSALEVLLLDNVSGESQSRSIADINRIIPKSNRLLAFSVKYNYFSNLLNISLHKRIPNIRYLGLANKAMHILSLFNDHNQFRAVRDFLLDMCLLGGLDILDLSGSTSQTFPLSDLQCWKPSPLLFGKEYPWAKYPHTPSHLYNCKGNLMKPTNSNGSLLKVLIIQHSSINGITCEDGPYVLPFEVIDISNMHRDTDSLFCSLQGPWLKRIHAKNIQIKHMNLDFFHKFPILAYLDLSWNNLGGLIHEDIKGIFFNMSWQLVELNLSHNYITDVPRGYFSHLERLEILDLSYNAIKDWTDAVSQNVALKHLNLANNPLRSFDYKVINIWTNHREFRIDLHDAASFYCDCDDSSVSTVKWLMSPSRSNNEGKGHLCSNSNQTIRNWFIQDYHTQCIDAHNWHPLWVKVLSSTTAVLLLLLFCLAGYLKRYSIEYRLYNVRERILSPKPLNSSWLSNCSLINICGEDIQFAVYLAVEEVAAATAFLLQERIMCLSLNNQSSAFGYRWSNASQDIERVSNVIIFLSEGCLDVDDKRKDFYFALEKGWSLVTTVVIGDITKLKKSSRPVRMLISKTTILHWATEIPTTKQLCTLKGRLMSNNAARKISNVRNNHTAADD